MFYRCVLLLFIVRLLSSVFVLRVSEMFSHLHHPQCCVIRRCAPGQSVPCWEWEEIQGQLQQSPEILQGQRFSCPLLAAPAFSIFTITWLIKRRVSALTDLVRRWITRKGHILLMCWSLWEQHARLYKVCVKPFNYQSEGKTALL